MIRSFCIDLCRGGVCSEQSLFWLSTRLRFDTDGDPSAPLESEEETRSVTGEAGGVCTEDPVGRLDAAEPAA